MSVTYSERARVSDVFDVIAVLILIGMCEPNSGLKRIPVPIGFLHST